MLELNSKGTKPRSVHKLFAVYAVPLAIVIFLISVAGLVLQRTKVVEEQRQSYENQLKSYYLEAMSDAVWDFRLSDIDSISIQINAFPHIDGVEVVSGQDTVVVAKGSVKSLEHREVIPLITPSQSLLADWRIHLYRKPFDIGNDLLDWVVQIAALVSVTFVSLWLLVKLCFSRFILRPSSPLREALQNFKLGDHVNPVLTPDGSSEMVGLISGYNKMARSINREQERKKELDKQTNLHFQGIHRLSRSLDEKGTGYQQLVEEALAVLLDEPDCGLACVAIGIGGNLDNLTVEIDSTLVADRTLLDEFKRTILVAGCNAQTDAGVLPLQTDRPIVFQKIVLGDSDAGCLYLETRSLDPQISAASRLFLVSISKLLALVIESQNRLQVERSLLETKSGMFSALSEMSVGICMFDSNGNTLLTNLSAEQLLRTCGCKRNKPIDNMNDLVGCLAGAVSINGFEFDQWLLAGGNQIDFELQVEKNRWISFSRTIQADGAVGIIIRDATQQKLEAISTAHDEKIKTLGRFSSGIMHDLNNFLQAISSNIEIAMSLPEDMSELRREQNILLENALASCDKAAKMSHQILGYSRKGSVFVESVDIESSLREICSTVASSSGKTISLTLNNQSEMTAFTDKYLFDRAITNIIDNSVYASAEKSLEIFANISDINSDRDDAKQYLSIRILDNCGGFDPDSLDKLSEPFYTSKHQGEGSGLGLFLVKDFVVNAGGELYFKNVAEGAEVELILPALAKNAQPGKSRNDGSVVDSIDLKSRMVLIIEDSNSLAEIVRRSFELVGASVILVTTLKELKELIPRLATVPDLVLSDINLPDGNGIDAVDLLKKSLRESQIPTVYMTGDPNELSGTRSISECVLRKPFSITELRDVCGKLLREQRLDEKRLKGTSQKEELETNAT